MRIYFQSLTRPKQLAHRVHEWYARAAMPEYRLHLHECQQIAAALLGYRNWHELKEVSARGDHAPSPSDEEVTAKEFEARISFQMEVMHRLTPLTRPLLREMILTWRPSNSFRPGPHVDLRTMNDITWDSHSGWNGPVEDWRFIWSIRSRDTADEVYNLLGTMPHDITTEDEGAVPALRDILRRVPEHVQAASAITNSLCEIGQYEEAAEVGLRVLPHVTRAFPRDFPESGAAPFNFYPNNNRAFLRFYLWTATALCKTHHPDRAKLVEDLCRFDVQNMMEGRSLRRYLPRRKQTSRAHV